MCIRDSACTGRKAAGQLITVTGIGRENAGVGAGEDSGTPGSGRSGIVGGSVSGISTEVGGMGGISLSGKSGRSGSSGAGVTTAGGSTTGISLSETSGTVSYTHLDVYKRQIGASYLSRGVK